MVREVGGEISYFIFFKLNMFHSRRLQIKLAWKIEHNNSKFVLLLEVAKKTFHIIISLAVLFSTTGLMLGEHFCKKEMQMAEAAALAKNDAPAKAFCGKEGGGCEKGCCSTEYEYFQSEQDKQVQNFEFKQLKQPEFLATLLIIFDIELPVFEAASANHLTYRPPIAHQDILPLFQTFLI